MGNIGISTANILLIIFGVLIIVTGVCATFLNQKEKKKMEKGGYRKSLKNVNLNIKK